MVAAAADGQTERARVHPLASALIGATAGAASKTVTAPVERVRLLLQMSTNTASSSATRAVLQKEGAAGLWRGNGLAVTRAMLQKGMLFSSQDYLRVALGSDMLAGSIAGATAAGLTYPLDLLRTRLAGQVGSGSLGAVARQAVSLTQGGGVLALWAGASATLFGGVVFEGARFGIFGWARDARQARARARGGEEETVLARMLLGPAGLGTMASLAAGNFIYPNDTVRRRLQTVEGRGESYVEAVRHLMREGGIARLYRGLLLYNLKAAPSAAVQFFTYHELKRLLVVFNAGPRTVGVAP